MSYAAPRGAQMRDRILALSMPEPNTGCWLWLAGVTSDGYSKIKVNGSSVVAHRRSYEAFIGPIPASLTLDHLCRVTSCVNPDHLEPVTNRENILRGNGISARLARQTHCKRGHELSGENLRTRPADGARICRSCAASRRRGGR